MLKPRIRSSLMPFKMPVYSSSTSSSHLGNKGEYGSSELHVCNESESCHVCRGFPKLCS